MVVLGKVLFLRKLVALGDGVGREIRPLGEEQDLPRSLRPIFFQDLFRQGLSSKNNFNIENPQKKNFKRISERTEEKKFGRPLTKISKRAIVILPFLRKLEHFYGYRHVYERCLLQPGSGLNMRVYLLFWRAM